MQTEESKACGTMLCRAQVGFGSVGGTGDALNLGNCQESRQYPTDLESTAGRAAARAGQVIS